MSNRMKFMLGTVIVLAVALAVDRLVINADDTLLPTREATTSAPAANPDRLPPSTKALLPAASQFTEIWQRTLFSIDRQPAAMITPTRTQAGTTDNTNTDQPPDFIIAGVAIRPGGGSALIKTARREMIRVPVGEQIEGWRVDALDPDYVTVSRNGDSWQLPVGGEE